MHKLLKQKQKQKKQLLNFFNSEADRKLIHIHIDLKKNYLTDLVKPGLFYTFVVNSLIHSVILC